MAERVGFVGLGAMGAPMAWNIHRAGFPLRVFNRSAPRTKGFAETGVPVDGTPAVLAAHSDLVLIMVSAARGLGLGDEDMAAVIKVLGSLSREKAGE